MKDEIPIFRPASYTVAALACLGLLGGWLILLPGGFQHQYRYTRETVLVTGLPALLMAAIMFALTVLGTLALVRTDGASLFWQGLACCAVLLPPALFQRLLNTEAERSTISPLYP